MRVRVNMRVDRKFLITLGFSLAWALLVSLIFYRVASQGRGQTQAPKTRPLVVAGEQLMALRSLTDIWVDANFKETQLGKLRIGQPADLDVDMYGRRQRFRIGADCGCFVRACSANRVQLSDATWI